MVVCVLLQNRNVDFAEGAAGALLRRLERKLAHNGNRVYPTFTHAIPQ